MLESLVIEGGNRLQGVVAVSGAKNAALPLLFATLLTGEPVILRNIPDLEDISVTLRLLTSLGAKTSFEGNCVSVHTPKILSSETPYGLVKLLRASFWALGPLVARSGEARVALPGGDAIGTRPVDLHLDGLRKLGAEIRLEHGVVIATAPGGLRPAKVELEFPSVGATHNILMAMALIDGESELIGAACEPEVTELASLLQCMGAEIKGAGTSRLIVKGKKALGSAEWHVLGDRIEAATYLLAGAVTQGEVTVHGISPNIIRSTLDVLSLMGCSLDESGDAVTLKINNRVLPVDVRTAPHPGFATDVQPLLMAALTKAQGVSTVTETIFESRFGHVSEYRRFGANISLEARKATIVGVETLSSAPVEGADIRAVAGLVLMALMAEGKTEIGGLHHLDRGYQGLVEKLLKLGAHVKRTPTFDQRELVVGC